MPECASDTDWQAAGITHATAQHMMVRGLIERDSEPWALRLERVRGKIGDGGVERITTRMLCHGFFGISIWRSTTRPSPSL
jgi:hypothetical protein